MQPATQRESQARGPDNSFNNQSVRVRGHGRHGHHHHHQQQPQQRFARGGHGNRGTDIAMEGRKPQQRKSKSKEGQADGKNVKV